MYGDYSYIMYLNGYILNTLTKVEYESFSKHNKCGYHELLWKYNIKILIHMVYQVMQIHINMLKHIHSSKIYYINNIIQYCNSINNYAFTKYYINNISIGFHYYNNNISLFNEK